MNNDPPQLSVDYNTYIQLELFCKKGRKWDKIPYVKVLWYCIKMNLTFILGASIHECEFCFLSSFNPRQGILDLI